MVVLALSGWVFSLGMLVFLLICLALVLAIMIQKPQGGGLSAAFGASSGSGQTAFGTKTGDALTVATILVFVVWLLLAMVLNIVSRPSAPAVVAPAAEGTSTPNGAPVSTPETPASTPTPGPSPSGTAPTPSTGVEVPATPTPAEPQNPSPTPASTPTPESTPR